LRQAYDYWQDQPGNYFPILLRKAPINKRPPLLQHHSVFTLSCRRVLSRVREFIKPRLKVQSQLRKAFFTQINEHLLAFSKPVTKPPCFSISQVSDTLSLSKVDKDYGLQ
jgi:hypothetical protein